MAKALLLTSVAPVAWGTTYVTTTELLPPDRPLFTAVVRALPAGLALLALRRRLPGRGWWLRSAALAGCNFGLFFPLLFLGAYRLPGGLAATVQATSPLVMMAFAYLLLHERATPLRVMAALVGLAGVAVLVMDPAAHLDTVGLTAAAGSVGASALGFVLVKRWPAPVDMLTLTGWQLVLGGLMLVPVSVLVEGGAPELHADAIVGYIWIGAVGTAVAYWCWFQGLQALPAGTVAMLGLLNPVTATILGVVAAGEDLRTNTVIGLLLVAGSVVAGQRRAGCFSFSPRRIVRRCGEAGA